MPTIRTPEVCFLFAHEPYYPGPGTQEINTTVVAADSLLHPQVRQSDGARTHDLLTKGRRPSEIIPLATLTHELNGGADWPTVGDGESVTTDLMRRVRSGDCDALSLGLPEIPRALVCAGHVRAYDATADEFIDYGPAERAAVFASVTGARMLTVGYAVDTMGGERRMVTRGFTGRPRRTEGAVPPGQFVTSDFPVLTAGPTQHVPTRAWELVVTDGTTERTYAWASLRDLGVVDLTTDIHCVTHWSKLGTTWQGVPVAAVLEDAGVADEPYALVSSYGGYTTNVPVEDLVGRDAMVAVGYEGGPIPAEHGGPVRLLVPHLYLWKSAKWLRGIRVMPEDEPGFWENAGYHHRGDPFLEQRYYGD